MSRRLALDSIWLRPTPRWGHTEYSLGYHTDYLRRVTGLDPGDPDSIRVFYDAWDFDMLWNANDGLHADWFHYGRATDMGHAKYAENGSDFRQASACPFQHVEEVWAFDAVSEYGVEEMATQVQAYETWWQSEQAKSPHQLVTGGYYKTIISGAIQAFGWDMLLEAAADLRQFETVLDSFFRLTLHHMEAWARTSAEVIIQHDDFVWTAGPFLHPEFYREVIIPRYAALWKPLHEAGKKVLFCSDGTFTQFAEDLATAGADGFIFEPSNPFEEMVDIFGASHVLVGSAVDCRDLSFSSWDVVQRQIEQTLALAQRCNGLIIAVGNHIPANISADMLDRYLAYYQAHWHRNPAAMYPGKGDGLA